MKKIIVFAFALAFAALPAAAANDSCGCTAGDVTCINNCTLSKISALRKNIQEYKETAKAKVQAAKAEAEAKQAEKNATEEAKEKVAAAKA
ncbi:MAG: hypothetical protein IKA93_03120, partial [Elusimicrobiaceae bacterium]|nr:hypothetical protein [Elusimicrobiaceae bacterium]